MKLDGATILILIILGLLSVGWFKNFIDGRRDGGNEVSEDLYTDLAFEEQEED